MTQPQDNYVNVIAASRRLRTHPETVKRLCRCFQRLSAKVNHSPLLCFETIPRLHWTALKLKLSRPETTPPYHYLGGIEAWIRQEAKEALELAFGNTVCFPLYYTIVINFNEILTNFLRVINPARIR